METLNTIFNIILSILNFMFDFNTSNPVFLVSVVFIVGLSTLGALKLLINRL